MNDKCHKRTAIIGAGMAGLLAAINLKKAKREFMVFEKADSLGGTWRDNRYPGLTCDVPAHAYTYSFAPYAEWNAYHATGPEIKRYFEKVAGDYGITPFIHFNTEITACHFQEASNNWELTDAHGENHIFDIVIVASGVLHHPSTPDITGLDDFQGSCFHSAQWEDDLILENNNIGIIGCGSSGIQIATALTSVANQLVHFQRSPQWIMPVEQFNYTEEEKQAFRDNQKLIDDIRYDKQYWDNIYRFNKGIINPDSPEMQMIEDICRDYLEASIQDPALREKLRPDYRAACKRLIYNWQYYDCVQNQNVFVETGSIDRVMASGVQMQDGTFHTLDILVLATGFHADRFIKPTSVIGRNGLSLDTFWTPRPTAHYAVTLPGFPNMFMLNGPTGPVGNFSLIDIAERQWEYIDQLLSIIHSGDAETVEPKISAFEDYEKRRIEAAQKTIFSSGCSSWYLDKTGIPMTWPWSYQDFADAMQQPILSEYDIRGAS